MKKNNWDFDYTLDFVKKARDIINPNEGFREQLLEFDKELKDLSLKESKDNIEIKDVKELIDS